MENYVGEIKLVGFSFAPRGWAFCQGQLLPIAQNQALFSLLGTQFGGDGRVSFALPDLRGRAPVGFGAGPGIGLSLEIGQKSTAAAGEGNGATHAMGMNYIIALHGIFPSRT